MSATPDPASVISRPLPVGTVTFAFTDIEGSTARWERGHAAMHDAVRRHDVVMRAAIETHGGSVFKTVGDAFCAVFVRPQDAVAAMVEAQGALAREDFSAVDGLRVRAAIHTGTAEERDGDYFGTTVNRVARLVSIGHGGQILVTGVSADIVHGRLPPRVSLHDLGQHRLKDLTLPERVYQVQAPELPHAFAPLRSLDILANNLPRQLTSLIGRDREVDEVSALLESAPLVTLVGSGGVGKTRVSLQVAANLVDGSGDGVWFVELAPLRDTELIPATIASAAGLTLSERKEPAAALVDALKERRMLLVLDNCEHLVDGVAAIAGAIVRSCPGTKILASSREAIGVEGEAVYRMPSLAVPPDMKGALKGDDIRSYGAVELFVNRASMASRSFTLTDANAPAVAEIVRRLDGIPLALELAATRLNVLKPDQLLARLEDRLRLLTGGDRTRMPRQQTLRALIDWSYDLLSERERDVFRRLGIFVGGWTLETAAALVEPDGFSEWDVLDILGSLVAKSLVVADLEEGSTARYRLLESTREYARDRLAQYDELQTIAQRHAEVFRAIVEQAEESSVQASNDESHVAIAPELGNVGAAFAWALSPDGDAETAARIAAAARRTWILAGLIVECHRLMKLAVDCIEARTTSVDAAVVAQLLLSFSIISLRLRRDREASDAALQALGYFRSVGDRLRFALAAKVQASTLGFVGRYDEAEAYFEEAAAIERAHGRRRGLAATLSGLALVNLIRGRLNEAREMTIESLKLHESISDTGGALDAMRSLAEIEFACGNVDEAIRLLQQVTVALQRVGDIEALGLSSINLTAYYIGAARYAEAGETALQALTCVDAQGLPMFQFVLCEHIALLAAIAEDLESATVLFGWSDDRQSRSGNRREPTEQAGYERLLTLLEPLEPSLLERLRARGAALDEAGVSALQRAVLESFPRAELADHAAGAG